jgi:hypothetical protein
MICYRYQFERNQTLEALMNNIIENVIATIIVGALSTAIAFILPTFGFDTRQSVSIATVALLALVLLFVVARRFYHLRARQLVVQLLENALRKLQVNPGVEPKRNDAFLEFPSQQACESHIRNAAHNAKEVKILTIRGEKYFVSSRSLLYDLYSSKRTAASTIEVLVLSPESQHITEEHARDLGHRSTEEIRRKMRITLDYLKHIAEQHKNFKVKYYDETPNFKILLFDDVMFVSSFADGGPKNDHNVKMLQITRDGNPVFIGLERHFDDLAKRSVSLE